MTTGTTYTSPILHSGQLYGAAFTIKAPAFHRLSDFNHVGHCHMMNTVPDDLYFAVPEDGFIVSAEKQKRQFIMFVTDLIEMAEYAGWPVDEYVTTFDDIGLDGAYLESELMAKLGTPEKLAELNADHPGHVYGLNSCLDITRIIVEHIANNTHWPVFTESVDISHRLVNNQARDFVLDGTHIYEGIGTTARITEFLVYDNRLAVRIDFTYRAVIETFEPIAVPPSQRETFKYLAADTVSKVIVAYKRLKNHIKSDGSYLLSGEMCLYRYIPETDSFEYIGLISVEGVHSADYASFHDAMIAMKLNAIVSVMARYLDGYTATMNNLYVAKNLVQWERYGFNRELFAADSEIVAIENSFD